MRLLFPLLIFCLAVVSKAQAEPIEVTAVAKQFNTEDPAQDRVGRLLWRTTLELESPDTRFGGFSGLLVSGDGRQLLAVSDKGHWLKADLDSNGAGTPTGLSGAELFPLRDESGAELGTQKERGDAEGLARGADRRLLVSFERDHRILAYTDPTSAAEVLPTDFGLTAGSNEGVEGLESLRGGDLLALVEGAAGAPGRGFLRHNGVWSPLAYQRSRSLLPVGATAAQDGRVYVVERSWSMIGGLEIRVVRLAAGSVAPGAELKPEVLAAMTPPLLIDNFEAIAARVTPGGETLLYLLSDDNFNPVQRTLLTVFAVE